MDELQCGQSSGWGAKVGRRVTGVPFCEPVKELGPGAGGVVIGEVCQPRCGWRPSRSREYLLHAPWPHHSVVAEDSWHDADTDAKARAVAQHNQR